MKRSFLTNLLSRTVCLLMAWALASGCLPEANEGNESAENQTTSQRKISMEPGKIYGGRKATSLKGIISFSISKFPEYGEIEIIDAAGTFEYRSIGATDSDQFTILAEDDNGNEHATEFKVVFSDTTQPQIANTFPADGALQAASRQTLEITFDDVIDTSSISVNQDDSCYGSIQVSADNFLNCISIDRVETEDNQRFQFHFSQPLESAQHYQVLVTSAVRNFVGLEKGNDSLLTFKTAAQQLLISEVGHATQQNFRWLEFYNASGMTIELGDYALVSQSSEPKVGIKERAKFPLPKMNIGPGEYKVVVIGKPKDKLWKRFRKLKTSAKTPFWNESGYVAIETVDNEDTIDYVAFGQYVLDNDSHWEGQTLAPQLAESNLEKFQSIVRYDTSSDSNSSADWRVQIVSPGLPNDTKCLEDKDQDGIPDCSELPGTTYSGLSLYAMGARVGQRDVFVEVDYMKSDDLGILPRKEALDKVVAAFAKNGIALHFDVGSLYGEQYNLGGGNFLPYYDRVDLKEKPNKPQYISVGDLKKQYMNNRRRAIFHYMVFGSQQNANLSSGRAEIFGDDTLVTLGGWNLSEANPQALNELINYQAATIMHELGHNFDLRHGGFEGANNKANYVSVMNYMYSLKGLPEIGNNEGDRYYMRFFHGQNCWGSKKLQNGPRTESFRIDFSYGESAPLELGRSSEAAGLGFGNSSPVDFNCDGDVNDIVESDDIKGSKSKVIKDHNDWGNLRFYFAERLAALSSFSQQLGRPWIKSDIYWKKQSPSLSEEPSRQEMLR